MFIERFAVAEIQKPYTKNTKRDTKNTKEGQSNEIRHGVDSRRIRPTLGAILGVFLRALRASFVFFVYGFSIFCPFFIRGQAEGVTECQI